MKSESVITSFYGAEEGQWKIKSIAPVVGESIQQASFLHIANADEYSNSFSWQLKGASSNARYTTKAEKKELVSRQQGLGRSEAVFGSLIPIKKSEKWWELTQDERRAIFEEQSQHIALSMKYLPAIARKLYHSKDLNEPFDFLTWFEFAPEFEADFDQLLKQLRSSEEWTYVVREIDIRVVKVSS
jgi:chlorite dismutase